jgi:hypothetical protein
LISLMSGMVGLGGAAASIVMNLTLQQPGRHLPTLLTVIGGATVVGAILFSIAGRSRRGFPEPQPAEELVATEAE